MEAPSIASSAVHKQRHVCPAKVALCPTKFEANANFVTKSCHPVTNFSQLKDNIFILGRISLPQPHPPSSDALVHKHKC